MENRNCWDRFFPIGHFVKGRSLKGRCNVRVYISMFLCSCPRACVGVCVCVCVCVCVFSCVPACVCVCVSLLSPPPDPAHTEGLNNRIPPTPQYDPNEQNDLDFFLCGLQRPKERGKNTQKTRIGTSGPVAFFAYVFAMSHETRATPLKVSKKALSHPFGGGCRTSTLHCIDLKIVSQYRGCRSYSVASRATLRH